VLTRNRMGAMLMRLMAARTLSPSCAYWASTIRMPVRAGEHADPAAGGVLMGRVETGRARTAYRGSGAIRSVVNLDRVEIYLPGPQALVDRAAVASPRQQQTMRISLAFAPFCLGVLFAVLAFFFARMSQDPFEG